MSDIWEQAAETYLAMDRALLLNPQYLIRGEDNWEACPDFLAVEFIEKTAWMVEVTKSPGSGLLQKVSKFNADYLPRIMVQLKKHCIVPATGSDSDWNVGLWIFLPKSAEVRMQNKMSEAGIIKMRLTALEDTVSPDAWEKRFR